jgi:hypothetical protein
MVTSPKGLGPEKDYVCEDQQHLQKTDLSSRKTGCPSTQDRNCQKVINIWSWAPDGARQQDLLIDWPSVAMWHWLWLDSGEFSSRWGDVNAVTVLVQGSYEWTIVAVEAREQESELGLGAQKETRGQPSKNWRVIRRHDLCALFLSGRLW